MTLQELMTRWNGYQIEMRRWFHQHPEESTKEVRTAERIRAELDRAGIPWRPCGLGTGTLARIEGAQPGRTILLRGDIDALSVNEETGLPYASEVPGVMHACGHDCHISMLLTAAMIVNEIRDRLKGTIVFAFQPAEELGLGARAMIEEGALEGVDACFGMHVWSDYPAGTVALRKGPMMASGDQFKIHVRGKSTHGAQPQLGADALIMGAAIAQNLQTIVSRETYPGDTAVVTVGKFHSGTRFNVVAGTAELEGTTRTFSPAVRDRFEEQITRIARSTAEAMRGTADVESFWGTFRFNVYFFMGVIGHVLAALLIYIITGQVYILTTDYLNFSLFFAFAATFPEMQFSLFFVLPIKAKYLALFDGLYFVYGFLFGGMSQRIAIVMSLLNFIVYLFMSRGSRLNPKEIRRKQVFHSQMREAQKTAEKIGRHRCAVCGRTEEDDPNLVFRYCSKCEGDYEYCQDHLYTHKHVTQGGMDPRQANSNQEA